MISQSFLASTFGVMLVFAVAGPNAAMAQAKTGDTDSKTAVANKLEEAKALSAVSGRPILAVAGLESWPPCTALMTTLVSNKSIAPYAAQFVPVKLDVNSTEYRTWSRDLERTGEAKGVPYVYVVRSDGETIYGQGGGISTENLKTLLMTSLKTSGRVLNAKEVETLDKAAKDFESLQSAGDISGALKAINKVKRLGAPGQIPSYAQAASKVNKLAETTATEVNAKLAKLSSVIESGETAEKLEAILAALQLGSDYSGLKILKPELAKFKKEIGKNKEITQLVKDAKVIKYAVSASSASAKKRAAEKLQVLIESSEIDAVKISAQQALAGLRE